MDRRFSIIVAVVVAAATGAGWWWTTHRSAPVEWQGYAEADFIKVGPTQQGLLTALFVMRGSEVTAGAPLFDQDDTKDRSALDQAKRMLIRRNSSSPTWSRAAS